MSEVVKQTRADIEKLRVALLEFKGKDGRAYSEKAHRVQIIDDLVNALVVELMGLESQAGDNPPAGCDREEGCAVPPEFHRTDRASDLMGEALRGFTEARLLQLEAEKNVSKADMAALMHVREQVIKR